VSTSTPLMELVPIPRLHPTRVDPRSQRPDEIPQAAVPIVPLPRARWPRQLQGDIGLARGARLRANIVDPPDRILVADEDVVASIHRFQQRLEEGASGER